MSNFVFDIESPSDNYIYNLCNVLTGPDFAIFQWNNADHLHDLNILSSEYVTSTDPNIAYLQALGVAGFIDATSFLIFEDKSAVRKIRLGDIRNASDMTFVSIAKPNIARPIPVDFSSFSPPVQNSGHPLKKLLVLASSEDFIRNLLIILSDGMTFISMYQAYDEIKTFLKGKISVQALGFSDKRLNHFSHTANSFPAIGAQARHGNLGHLPPATPMTIEEAQTLISEVIYAVLNRFFGVDLGSVVYKKVKFEGSTLF